MAAGASTPGEPPPVEVLRALDSDAWAQLLVALREILRSEPAGDAELEWFRDAPTSRLVSGRGREAVCVRLAGDARLYDRVAGRLRDAGHRPPVAAEHGSGTGPPPPGEGPATRERIVRLRERSRRAREDRDAWQRRAEGEQARADRLEAEVARLTGRVRDLEEQVGEARDELEAGAAVRERAVERERRRHETELDRLRREATALRRELERRRREAEAATNERSARDVASRTPERLEQSDGPTTLRPGRPSRLPAGVEPGTTQAARALLHPDRLVLVDGYNVSRQHRPHLDLEQQRRWLVQLLGTLATMRGVRPVVVFDGERAGGGRSPSARGVQVRFTDAGITADDELVLAVEGTDEPVVVVTDDRELRERVRRHGADILDTVSFLGAARSGG